MTTRPRRPPKQRPPAPDAVHDGWRLFLAVPLSDDLRALVTELVQELSAEEWPVRWVNPDGAHLTLHFLGETPPEQAELLRLALAGPVARHAPCSLTTTMLHAFPHARWPRVIALQLHDPDGRLNRLHDDMAKVLRGLDLPVERARLRPHITLGRLRDINQGEAKALAKELPDQLAALDTRLLRDRPPVQLPVNEVRLYRSFLERTGARYETVARFPLGESKADMP